MDSPPPLTADSLRQFAKDEQELQEGLSEDCQALEDVMVRLAGPTLQGIEEDTAKLEELQQKLAAPALEGIKLDMRRITKILRKLTAPIDQSIAEDTTLLTGIAARAQGSSFPAHGRGNVAGRPRPIAAQVVQGTPHSPTRPTAPYQQPAAMGHPGTTPIGAPIGSAGYSALRPTPVPSSQSVNTLDGIDLTVTSGATSGGVVGIGANPYAPSLPPVAVPPTATGGPRPSTNPFNVVIQGVDASPLPPSPFQAPSPSSVLPQTTPGSSTQQLQPPGSVSPFQPPSPSQHIPAPPPPLPETPEPTDNPLESLLSCCTAIAQQLNSIAASLHCLCNQTVQTALGQFSSSAKDDELFPVEWTDPTGQDEIDKDSLDWPDRQKEYEKWRLPAR